MKMLAGPCERLAADLSVSEEMPLEGFEHGFIKCARCDDVTLKAPQSKGSNIKGSFIAVVNEKL